MGLKLMNLALVLKESGEKEEEEQEERFTPKSLRMLKNKN